jgi:putative cell wall-binding protein
MLPHRLVASLLAVVAGSTFGLARAGADTPPPEAWPATSTLKPGLDGWANAIRISGANRFQTALAASLTLRGAGGAASYPFGSPDPATTDGWFGLGSCPRSVIVVAGDNPADALSASSLSDATGNSTEPYLRISAAADQVFDPVGDFRRVDTDFAPILITTSTRQGATALNIATRLAAQDLRSGGCTTAREAIIVGGTSAVPANVETELVSIGYDRVYRVAGASRYETARLVAESLGTADASVSPTPTTCTDVRVDDGAARMTFYANSVVEYRASATECQLLSRTVVLADGVTGADALAAGWWTSYWQVPMLLHNGSGALPAATREALQTLAVENVIVLGGTSRISAAVVDEVRDVTGQADVIRIAGNDRYETSVKMAQSFGGWYATGRGDDFAGSRVCIAASTGSTLGWPDALSAGPWCGRYTATARNAPVRALAPTLGTSPTTSAVASLARPAHDAVPVLLVPASVSALPASVQTLLSNAFTSSSTWCSSTSAPVGCLAPGFAVVFGGSTAIPDSLIDGLSSRMIGSATVNTTDRSPRLDEAFFTMLDMSPVFDDTSGASGGGRVCAVRDDYANARWLFVSGATQSASVDVMLRGRYVRDTDGTVRAPTVGSPVCVAAPAGTTGVRAVAGSGPVSGAVTLDTAVARRVGLSATISASAPVSSNGIDSSTDLSEGGTTTWTFSFSPAGVSLSALGTSSSVTSSTLSLTLTRGATTSATTAPDRVSGTFSLVTASGSVQGTIEGETILVAGVWKIRGRVTFTGGSGPVAAGSGGFVADLAVNSAGTLADDAVVWRLDGLAT